jgi:hypothetical protein
VRLSTEMADETDPARRQIQNHSLFELHTIGDEL